MGGSEREKLEVGLSGGGSAAEEDAGDLGGGVVEGVAATEGGVGNEGKPALGDALESEEGFCGNANEDFCEQIVVLPDGLSA